MVSVRTQAHKARLTPDCHISAALLSSPPPAPPPRLKKPASGARTEPAKDSSMRHVSNTGTSAGQANTTKRSRPQLYVPSDSESEDDVPLRKPGPSLKRTSAAVEESADMKPQKRTKVAGSEPILESTVPTEEPMPKVKGKSRAKDDGPPRAKGKKTVVADQQLTVGETEELETRAPRSRKASGSKAAKTDADLADVGDGGDKKSSSKTRSGGIKKGTKRKPERAESEEVPEDSQAKKALRKRRKAETDEEDDGGRGHREGQAAGRVTKRRRKAADIDIDIDPEAAVAQAGTTRSVDAGKPSARQSDAPAGIHENKGKRYVDHASQRRSNSSRPSGNDDRLKQYLGDLKKTGRHAPQDRARAPLLGCANLW